MESFLVSVFSFNENYEYKPLNTGKIEFYDDGTFKVKCGEKYDDEVYYGNFKDPSTFLINQVKTNNNEYDIEIFYSKSFSDKKFGIRFDSYSSSAKTKFIEKYYKCKSSIYHKEYYPGGQLKCEGEYDNSLNLYSGKYFEYYESDNDNDDIKVKFIGEVDDNEYDGKGKFFSYDGIITIEANNICNSIPNGTGIIYLNNKKYKTIEFEDFEDLNSKDNNYFKNILKRILKDDDYEKIIEQEKFKSLSTDEKLIFLFNELRTTKKISTSKPNTGLWSFLN